MDRARYRGAGQLGASALACERRDVSARLQREHLQGASLPQGVLIADSKQSRMGLWAGMPEYQPESLRASVQLVPPRGPSLRCAIICPMFWRIDSVLDN